MVGVGERESGRYVGVGPRAAPLVDMRLATALQSSYEITSGVKYILYVVFVNLEVPMGQKTKLEILKDGSVFYF